MPKRIAWIILDAVGLDQDIATVHILGTEKRHKVADAGYCLTSTMSRGMSGVPREYCVMIRGSARVEYSMRSLRKLGQKVHCVFARLYSRPGSAVDS